MKTLHITVTGYRCDHTASTTLNAGNHGRNELENTWRQARHYLLYEALKMFVSKRQRWKLFRNGSLHDLYIYITWLFLHW